MHAEGVVLYQGRVYVPDNPQLCHDLVHAHHSAIVAGHPRHWKMLELVSWNYWWPGLSRYITKFVAGCDVCNQCRWDNNLPHESFVESSSRARMSYHNCPKSCLHSIM